MRYFSQLCFVGSLILSSSLIQASGSDTDSDNGVSTIRLQRQFDIAQQAFFSGLPVVAERHFRSMLEQGVQDPKIRVLVRTRVACALIAQKKFEAAETELKTINPQYHNSLYRLYYSLLKFTNNPERKIELSELDADFLKIELAALSAFDRVWYWILQALVAELKSDFKSAQVSLNQARMECQQFSDDFSFYIQQVLDFFPLAAGSLVDYNIWEPLLNEVASNEDASGANLIAEAFKLQKADQTKLAIDKIELYKQSLAVGSLELERALLLQALFYEEEILLGTSC